MSTAATTNETQYGDWDGSRLAPRLHTSGLLRIFPVL